MKIMQTKKKSFWNKLNKTNQTAIIVALIAFVGTISYAVIVKPTDPSSREILMRVLGELKHVSVKYPLKADTNVTSLDFVKQVISIITETRMKYDEISIYLSEEDQQKFDKQFMEYEESRKLIIKEAEHTSNQKETLTKAFEFLKQGIIIRGELESCIKARMKYLGYKIVE